MKRSLPLLFAIAIKMVVVAQTATLPMLVEGRKWIVASVNPAVLPSGAKNGYYDILGRTGGFWGLHTYVLEGDTIIGGVAYKSLFRDGKFISGLREEDGRVYTPLGLLYDFNAQIGDIFPETEENISWLQVGEVRQVSMKGQDRRCLDMYYYYYLEYSPGVVEIMGGSRVRDYWIEGIGCTGNLVFPFWVDIIGPQPLLLSCYDGDECVFDVEEFAGIVTTSIKDIPKAIHSRSASPDSPLYDLQGRRISATPQKGVYIQNGKKTLVK